MSSLFDKNIMYLKGVGESRAKLFYKLGIDSVGALLRFYPVDYQEWTPLEDILEAPYDTTCCIKATVTTPVKEISIKGNRKIFKFTVSDETASVDITIFNNPYAAKKIDYEKEYLFLGKLSNTHCKLEMMSPAFQVLSETSNELQPVYHQTKGLTNRYIQKCVKLSLSMLPETIQDNIPSGIREKYNLCSLKDSIINIHFPKNKKELELARKRLVFEEFFLLQLGLLKSKNSVREKTSFNIEKDYSRQFEDLLEFELTKAQKRAISECVADLKRNTPMNRLIQGDVGSGKTVIAGSLFFTAKKNSLQSAFMAPTEILAEQHYKSLYKLFSKVKNFEIELLTSSTTKKQRTDILERLKNGAIDLLIGTHSLITHDVKFKNLGLIVTDEQHRFGVSQRSLLYEKGENPHILVMSATPIPRTLALMLYGDLDVSVIDELPPNRKPVQTYWINTPKLNRAYSFLKQQIKNNNQIYVVCPLVEENDMELTSASSYYEELKNNEFKDYKLGLLHGKMNSKEKNQIMNEFKQGNIDILISTTVIEVGVDVPNANVILIRNAERFGLSQLHQLRGRVGRGNELSYCILVSDSRGENTVKRLSAMIKTNNGFKIADEDLKLRGPGDFFGSRQHGIPQLKIANLLMDTNDLKQAQQAAQNVIENDPTLSKEENKTLRASVKQLFSNVKDILN